MIAHARLFVFALTLSIVMLLPSGFIQAATFSGLGDLPGGNYLSYGLGASADGSVVVGRASPVVGDEAFRWTLADGMVGLGYLPGGSNTSAALAVSADGSTIAGWSRNASSNTEAFRWTSAGMVGLGYLPGSSYSAAHDVNADGSVLVGFSGNFMGSYEAFRWTSAGMVSLGSLAGASSFAYGVSADGNVIVGHSANQAFRWTSAGMVGLGVLPGATSSVAYDVSAEGNVVVGESGMQAFRWTTAGMVGLGDLPGGSFFSSATSTSADGGVVVGRGRTDAGWEAFVWDADNGMQSIADLLVADGIDLTGWSLNFAEDVSDDGTVIVGYGGTPNGSEEAWLVRLSSGLMSAETIASSAGTLLPATESAHGLARESLETHLQASRHYRSRSGSRLNLYLSGFGGQWNSYTAGGTLGVAYDLNDSVRLGGGLFTSTYYEDDLAYSSEYELESFGGTFWAGYEAPGGGIQLHAVGLLANLDNEIERGYLNGSGLDKSKGSPDGTMTGLLVRAGWKSLLDENTSVIPFASYSWTEVEIDAYAETGGGFPAQFDSRKDTAEVLKLGIEGEKRVCQSASLWGQVAFGHRIDNDSDGITGSVIGLMDFTLPGYDLDEDWLEADLGVKWQVSEGVSVMLTAGSAFGNDQNPDWRTGLSLSWAL